MSEEHGNNEEQNLSKFENPNFVEVKTQLQKGDIIENIEDFPEWLNKSIKHSELELKQHIQDQLFSMLLFAKNESRISKGTLYTALVNKVFKELEKRNEDILEMINDASQKIQNNDVEDEWFQYMNKALFNDQEVVEEDAPEVVEETTKEESKTSVLERLQQRHQKTLRGCITVKMTCNDYDNDPVVFQDYKLTYLFKDICKFLREVYPEKYAKLGNELKTDKNTPFLIPDKGEKLEERFVRVDDLYYMPRTRVNATYFERSVKKIAAFFDVYDVTVESEF
ncbi:MAG: hypothetical protein ACOCQD_02265 [archaeon]